MKIISFILLILLARNLFAQEKHSELYYKVDSIYKANAKPVDDTITPGRIKLFGETTKAQNRKLLIIDGIPQEFSILDEMDLNKMASINFFKGIPSSCRSLDGIIIVQTKEGLKNQEETKKKKRKHKTN